jgi:Protein of unknown function (DUF1592)/Protein of unknown function (DUF1588)/Protein of unknown function (DUF1595)/Protein of unknown function (DUF1585)
MKEKQNLVAVGVFSTALAACTGVVMDGSTPADGSGPNGTGMASGGTTGGGDLTDPKVCVVGVPATSQIPRLLNLQYDAVMRDLLGVTALASGLPSSMLNADFDGPMNPFAWQAYQDAAAAIASQVLTGANRSKFIGCDPAAAGCLNQTIKTFGRKAFRRPLTDAEVARFEKLSQTTPPGTPEEVAETTLFSFLVSPSFVMLPELNAEPEGPSFKLSSHEVATRLSFLLWGSVPDDLLSAAADTGQLVTKEQILAQAQRMIAVREKTGPLVAAFHRRYVDMDDPNSHWWKVQHDTAKFPLYSEATVPAMAAELDAFFEEVAFGGGSFKDLFLSNVAYVTKDTAPLYGLNAASYGTELSRVELDPAQRPGFLTRLGFLSSYSSFGSSSPILRGAFITVNMLGVDPGPPNPEALQVSVPPGNYTTQRQYTVALTERTGCSHCHISIINPPGFVLENYSAIGSWQTVDPLGGPIDATAKVTFSEDNSQDITSPRQLMEEIGKGPLGKRIYAEKWVSFAFGRLPNSNDACVVNDLDTKLANDGYTVLTLLADLTQADAFRLRTREN